MTTPHRCPWCEDGGWQPMDMAPHDSRNILVKTTTGEHFVANRHSNGAWWSNEGFQFWASDLLGWLPIPGEEAP